MRTLLLLLLAGCTLFEKGKPLDVRYFTPELGDAVQARPPDAGDTPRARVRLGRVTARAHLRERIAYREAPVRLRLYEGRRWTADPDAFVRRALARALFEHGGFEQALGGAVPTLEVEVLDFEEVRAGAGPVAARVRLAYQLHDDRTVLASGTITATHPVRGDSFEAVVASIAAAMQEATERIAGVVANSVGDRSDPADRQVRSRR